MSTDNRVSRERAAAVDAALARLWPERAQRETRNAAAIEAEQAVAERVETIWNDVPLLRDRERYAELVGPPTWRERLVASYRDVLDIVGFVGRVPAFAAAATLLLIVTITIKVVDASSTGSARSFQTARAETQLIQLEDGSTVTLGAKSALNVDYTRQARNVTLAAGEAFFSVAHDASRPFIVAAGDTKIQVVGTKFNVNRTPNGVQVSVLEGVVRVIGRRSDDLPARSAESGSREVALRPGQQATLEPDAAALQVSALTVAQPGSWRTGSFTYEDATLAQLVADANRYYPREIRIASARGAQMRLTTSFRTTQIDQFLETVQTALPLDVQRAPDGEITIVDRR